MVLRQLAAPFEADGRKDRLAHVPVTVQGRCEAVPISERATTLASFEGRGAAAQAKLIQHGPSPASHESLAVLAI
jgi:hypothetical protein